MMEESRLEVEMIPPSDEEGGHKYSPLISLAKEAWEEFCRMRRESRERSRESDERIRRIRLITSFGIASMREESSNRRRAMDTFTRSAESAQEKGSVEEFKLALDKVLELAVRPPIATIPQARSGGAGDPPRFSDGIVIDADFDDVMDGRES